jgi:TatD DNase family protein
MSRPELIDVDCNLWHRDLKSLQGEDTGGDDYGWTILEEDAIELANIVAMVSPSSTISEAKQGLQLLSSKPPPLSIKTTVGIHPYHVNDDGIKGRAIDDLRSTIKALLEEYPSHCAAVGECGLDASEGFPPLEEQIPLFRLQVELANQFHLPLFIHERLAFQPTMDILQDAETPVIIHCFTGTKDQCLEYIKRGYFISVSGFILKETSDNYNEVISCLAEDVIPLDKLMIETDAPYMGFSGCRQMYMEHNDEFVGTLNSKKRKKLQQSIYPNVPSSLPFVLDKVVECYKASNPNLSSDEIARKTTANARSFFGL